MSTTDQQIKIEVVDDTHVDTQPIICCGYSGGQLRVMFITFIMSLFSYMNYGLMAPFYPQKAADKGMTNTEIGFVFGIYAFVIFVTAILIGKCLPRINMVIPLIGGYFLSGVFTIAFGFLDYCEDRVSFTVLSFVLRCCTAFFVSSFLTTSLAMLSLACKEKIAFAMGLSELFVAAGFICGPLIGGLIYSVGGYKAPFLVIGGTIIATCPIFYLLYPSGLHQGTEKTEKENDTSMKIWKRPTVFLQACAAGLGIGYLSYLEPNYSPYITEELGFTVVDVSLMLSMLALSYAVVAAGVGKLADNIPGHVKYVILIGSMFLTVGAVLIGPSPLLKQIIVVDGNCTNATHTFNGECFSAPTALWWNYFAMVCVGIPCAFTVIPVVQCIITDLQKWGYPMTFANYSMVSGIFNSAMGFGNFFSPIMSGVLADLLPLPWVFTIGGLLPFSVTVIFTLLIIHERYTQSDDNLNLEKAVNSVNNAHGESPVHLISAQPGSPENTRPASEQSNASQ